MTDLTQEISEDYDIDYDDTVDDCDTRDPLAGIFEVAGECDMLQQEIERLIQTGDAISQFGMSPGTFQIMQSGNLLTSTALESLSASDFSLTGPDSFESQMALEAVEDQISEKRASWGAKILSFVKTASSKFLGVLGSLKDKIVTMGNALASKTWDATKSAGRTIKAHPVKTVLALLAAAAVVSTVIGLVATPGSFASSMSIKNVFGRIKSLVNGIKLPFGKIQVEEVTRSVRQIEVHEVSFHTTKTIDIVTETKTMRELGWTQSAVRAVLNQFGRVWTGIKSGIGSLLSPVTSILKKANTHGDVAKKAIDATVAAKTKSPLAGWAAGKYADYLYTTALWSATGVVVKLISTIALKAFRAVADSFKQIQSAEPAKA